MTSRKNICPNCYKGIYCDNRSDDFHLPYNVIRPDREELKRILKIRMHKQLKKIENPNNKKLELCHYCQVGNCLRNISGLYHLPHNVNSLPNHLISSKFWYTLTKATLVSEKEEAMRKCVYDFYDGWENLQNNYNEIQNNNNSNNDNNLYQEAMIKYVNNFIIEWGEICKKN